MQLYTSMLENKKISYLSIALSAILKMKKSKPKQVPGTDT
jgi:hypothetical protein